VYIPYREAYFRDDDADARSRPLHDLEIARAYGREDDAGLCQNHQSEEGRGGEFGEWIVRLISGQSTSKNTSLYYGGHI